MIATGHDHHMLERFSARALLLDHGAADRRRRVPRRAAPLPRGAARVSPRVTVAVATCGRSEALARCLAGLRAQNAPADELLVVDQAPSAEARAVARSAGARYLEQPRLGLSASRNLALAEAAGDVLAVTDDDCVPDPAWWPDSSARRSGAGPGRRRRPDPAAARRAATRDLRDLAAPLRGAHRPRRRRRAVARRQRRELRCAVRGCGSSAAGTSGSARARRAGRPRTRTCSTGSSGRADPCATSLRRSCGTSGSRARGASPRAGRTPTGSARCAGSGWGAASAAPPVGSPATGATTSACCSARCAGGPRGAGAGRPRARGHGAGSGLRPARRPRRGGRGVSALPVTVVLCTRNRPALLHDTVRSVLAHPPCPRS